MMSHLSPIAFKIFFLSLSFSDVIIMCLGVDLSEFNSLEFLEVLGCMDSCI